ncbi:hypothetical protein [Pseudoclavibacter sp. 8L]|nr:hypothetical protein [Pseudoclavibacter sp. 8L]VXB33365.1 hypothetical protein PSCLAVI8L_130507 [Pseudoclavibacter sp. 8L]
MRDLDRVILWRVRQLVLSVLLHRASVHRNWWMLRRLIWLRARAKGMQA